MEQGSKEMKLQGRYPECTVYSHPIPQRALAIATLLLQERGEAWTAGGRKRAGEGLREERMEQGSKEMKLQGRYPECTVYSHPIPQRALAIATLLLQMKNSEHV